MTAILAGDNSLPSGPLLAGPVVGQVGPNDAIIWVQARTDGSIVTCAVQGTTISQGATAHGPYGIIKFHLTGLFPGFTYGLQITASSHPGQTVFGTVTTSDPAARRTRIEFGSCYAHLSTTPAVFQAIQRDQPDLFIFAGDSVYFGANDYDTEQHMFLAHLQTRNQMDIRAALTGISTIATWDDHDYGPNNSDGSFAGKDLALSAWMNIWPNAQFGHSPTVGAFSSVRHGPAEVFLLDDRYHRIETGKPGATILGADQLAWLKAALLASTASIKLIVSGSVCLPEFIGASPIHGWEGWQTNASADRESLISYIEAHNLTGVVFLSGDLHLGYLYHRLGTPLANGKTGPEYWELTSSPLDNTAWPRPVVHTGDDTFYDANICHEVTDRNYGVVDIDLDRTGAEVRLELRNGAGNAWFSRDVALSTLKTRTQPDRLRAISWVGGKAYFFRGDRYVRYTVGNVGSVQHVDSGYPAQIAGNWQAFDQLDGGFVSGPKAYLFSRNGYLRMSPPAGNPDAVAGQWTGDPDYPAYLAHVWGGFWDFDFDAAVVWPSDNKLYVFRGTQFVRCAIDAHVAEAAPASISSHFPDVLTAFPDGIDAAVVWSSTTVYFFKGTQYARFTIASGIGSGIDLTAYPKSFATAWPDLVTL